MNQAQEKHHMHIVLTQAQYETLSAKAQACGLSKRAFLARLIEGTPVKARPPQELRALRVELNRIGILINQIARKANAGLASRAEIQDAFRLLAEAHQRGMAAAEVGPAHLPLHAGGGRKGLR